VVAGSYGGNLRDLTYGYVTVDKTPKKVSFMTVLSAAEALRLLATDPATDPGHRYEAAQDLAGLGRDSLADAVEALKRLAKSADVATPIRRWAAEAVIGFGEQHRPDAVLTLRDLLQDTQVDAWNCYWAAEALTELDPDARRIAAEGLKRLAAGPGSEGMSQAFATAHTS
jgi:hypothetical protein